MAAVSLPTLPLQGDRLQAVHSHLSQRCHSVTISRPFIFHHSSSSSSLDMSEPVTVAALKAGDVIPDVLPESHTAVSAASSLACLPVSFNNDAVTVTPGCTLTPTATAQPPRIALPAGLPVDSLYSVVVFDADPPSRRRPRFRCFLHLLQVNIPQSAADVFAAGSVRATYIAPGPPQGGGKHRYVFLCYKQGAELQVDKLPGPFPGMGGRGSMTAASVEAALVAAGAQSVELVAVNWFEAEWDEEVDRKMREMMGIAATPIKWVMKLFL
jgi:hypothetical protein